MLVVILKNQVIAPQQVCQGCLLADSEGQPRWRQGRLCCGQLVRKVHEQQPLAYECQMGFKLVDID
jgi:hypothetical protein